MIDQEIRDNILTHFNAKLSGKTIEYESVDGEWCEMAKDCWTFPPNIKYRIAPEPQEKMKRWAVKWRSFDQPMVDIFDTEKEALEFMKKKPQSESDVLIELTETARIEPKQREPRRRWVNRYDLTESVYSTKEAAHLAGDGDAHEVAVEFVEVLKGGDQPVSPDTQNYRSNG